MPLTDKEANKLVDVIKGFVKPGAPKIEGPTLRGTIVDEVQHAGPNGARRVHMDGAQDVFTPGEPLPFSAPDEEALYQKFKTRLLEELPVDPIMLSIVMARPEIRLMVERREVSIDGKSLKGRLAALIASGFLDELKPTSAINRELDRTGGLVNSGNLARALGDFKVDGLVTKDGDGWRKAPGVNVTASMVASS